MNTCVSKKRKNQAKKNANSGTKKTMIKMTITTNMKTRRKSGRIYLTRSSLHTLYCHYQCPPLSWEDRDLISNNAYWICLTPSAIEFLVFNSMGM